MAWRRIQTSSLSYVSTANTQIPSQIPSRHVSVTPSHPVSGSHGPGGHPDQMHDVLVPALPPVSLHQAIPCIPSLPAAQQRKALGIISCSFLQPQNHNPSFQGHMHSNPALLRPWIVVPSILLTETPSWLRPVRPLPPPSLREYKTQCHLLVLYSPVPPPKHSYIDTLTHGISSCSPSHGTLGSIVFRKIFIHRSRLGFIISHPSRQLAPSDPYRLRSTKSSFRSF